MFQREFLITVPYEIRNIGKPLVPTTAVRGSKPDLGMWDFVMDKSGAGAGFLRELRFPLQIYFPSALHNHLQYHRGWHNRPGVAAVPIVSQTK
jgi:hypothetical protein